MRPRYTKRTASCVTRLMAAVLPPSGKAMKAKDLKSSEVQGKSDAELAGFITQGKDKMPAFGKKLKPDDINQLVAYTREMAAKK